MTVRLSLNMLVVVLALAMLVLSGCEDDPEVSVSCDDARPCGDKQTCIQGTCVDDLCTCPAVADPVCGLDGNTYGNACEAGCAGVAVGRAGACTTVCTSNDECGMGQICTAEEECLPPPGCTDPAACVGACWGRCVPGGCDCPATESPVCGTDGLTYRNECEAKCTGAGVKNAGPCPTCSEVNCELDCPWGYTSDPNGCSMCQCAEPPSLCNALGRCDEGFLCDRRACVPSCPDCLDCNAACLPISECDCPEPHSDDVVCGQDGVTYDSYCHAACVGVEPFADGACGESCEPLERCNLVCPWGFDTDDDGCSICSCAPAPELCQNDGSCTTPGAVCDPDACAPSCPGCKDCNPACVVPELPCGCKPESDPVCADDGLYYDSLCLAECAGFKPSEDPSLCETQLCVCDAMYAPVCGADGTTYSNACEARCAEQDVVYFGRCECQRSCAQSVPVCGANGVTYTCGLDEAICNQADVRWAGECTSPQLCNRDNECGPAAVCDPEACAPSCPSCDDCNSACKPRIPNSGTP